MEGGEAWRRQCRDVLNSKREGVHAEFTHNATLHMENCRENMYKSENPFGACSGEVRTQGEGFKSRQAQRNKLFIIEIILLAPHEKISS